MCQFKENYFGVENIFWAHQGSQYGPKMILKWFQMAPNGPKLSPSPHRYPRRQQKSPARGQKELENERV